MAKKSAQSKTGNTEENPELEGLILSGLSNQQIRDKTGFAVSTIIKKKNLMVEAGVNVPNFVKRGKRGSYKKTKIIQPPEPIAPEKAPEPVLENEPPPERSIAETVVYLKDELKLPFSLIGEKLGFSRDKARIIYNKTKGDPEKSTGKVSREVPPAPEPVKEKAPEPVLDNEQPPAMSTAEEVVYLRDELKLYFSAIAEKLGFSRDKARAIYYKAKRIVVSTDLLPENPTVEMVYPTYGDPSGGKTLLEEYAAIALQGLLANVSTDIKKEGFKSLAKDSFSLGFEMLKQAQKYREMYFKQMIENAKEDS